MEIYVLDRLYNQIGIVDGFTSFLWVKRYVQFGDCEIYISATRENIDLLQKGHFILRSDDNDMICRIRAIELETNPETGDFLIVKGEDCRAILNQRIVWKQTNFRGYAGDFIARLLDQNIINPTNDSAHNGLRKISNFTRAVWDGFTDRLEIQSTFDRVGDKIIEVCQTFNYGSKVSFEDDKFVFDLYKGVDRSYGQNKNPFVVFSPNFENLISTRYTMDSNNYCSIALVGGVGEGSNRHRVTTHLGDYVGIDRFEMFVDANDISNELTYDDLKALYPNGTISTVSGKVYYSVSGERIATLDDADEPSQAVLENTPYYEMLTERGKERLAETGTLITFDGQVEPNESFEYGKDYFLGDIVTVINEYGIEANARITEVIESFDETGHSIVPTFEYIEVV